MQVSQNRPKKNARATWTLQRGSNHQNIFSLISDDSWKWFCLEKMNAQSLHFQVTRCLWETTYIHFQELNDDLKLLHNYKLALHTLPVPDMRSQAQRRSMNHLTLWNESLTQHNSYRLQKRNFPNWTAIRYRAK